MKKYFLILTAVGIALAFSAFKVYDDKRSNKFVDNHVPGIDKSATSISWVTFEYIGGPHDSPYSYNKVNSVIYLDEYCPGSWELCAIYAEEDLFFNPGRPTQASLNYLLNNFGFYYYFPCEVPGLIEFKW